MKWEDENNIEKVKEKVDFVLNGCKCKTGCATNRCKCKKGLQFCGPGCECTNCINQADRATYCERLRDEVIQLELEGQVEGWEGDEFVEESDEEITKYEDEDFDEIMTFVFGEDVL